jgi:hypothetical protein
MDKKRFVICVNNEGYTVSLEKGKVYRLLEPEPEDPEGYVRVVDESGEDYLFQADRFFELTLPQRVADALEAA